jgi:hypothetical protein
MRKVISVSGISEASIELSLAGIGPLTILKELLNLGYDVTSRLDGDFLVSFNHEPDSYRKFLANGGKASNAILIRTEPYSVLPSQYSDKVRRSYLRIFTPGSVSDFETGENFIGWPYSFHENASKPEAHDKSANLVITKNIKDGVFMRSNWMLRPNLLTMVSSNKVSPTFHNNYSLRRQFASELAPNVLITYGGLWNDNILEKLDHRFWVLQTAIRNHKMPNLRSLYGGLFRKFPTAKGMIKSKHGVLLQSKFSLVIENSNSYVSEKLFDSLIAGSIPIYFGPELSSVGLPSGIAIESGKKTFDLERTMKAISEEEIDLHLSKIEDFLLSDLFLESWSATSVWANVSKAIDVCFRKIPK